MKYTCYDFQLDSLLYIIKGNKKELVEVKEILRDVLHVGHLDEDGMWCLPYSSITPEMIPNSNRDYIINKFATKKAKLAMKCQDEKLDGEEFINVMYERHYVD